MDIRRGKSDIFGLKYLCQKCYFCVQIKLKLYIHDMFDIKNC